MRPIPTILSFSLLSFLVSASSQIAEAQQPTKVPRIGFLFAGAPSAVMGRIKALRQGLQERGYVEGKNIVIEYRYGEGNLDRMLPLAAELVHLKVDVIVTGGPTDTRAAKQATTTLPHRYGAG